MRAAASIILSLAISSVTACNGRSPTHSDPTAQEVYAFLDANAGGRPVLDASATDCQDAQLDDVAVRVCNVCEIAVGIGRNDRTFEEGAFLQVVKRTGSVAFRRAFSAEQPNLEPAAGQRGTWVAVSNSVNLETTSVSPLSDAQMQRAGYVRRRQVGAFMDSASTAPRPEVTTRLREPAFSTALVQSVGACPSGLTTSSAEAPSTSPTSVGTATDTVSNRPPLTVFTRIATASEMEVGDGVRLSTVSFTPPTTVTVRLSNDATGTIGVEPSGSGTAISVRLESTTLDAQALADLATSAAAALKTDVLTNVSSADFSRLQYWLEPTPRSHPLFYVENCGTGESVQSIASQAVVALPPVMSRYSLTYTPRLVVITDYQRSPPLGCVQAGYQYSGSPPSSGLLIGRTGSTPAGMSLHAVYVGASDGVPAAYQRLEALMNAARLERGAVMERYAEGAYLSDNPVTVDIYQLVSGDTDRLRRIHPPR